MLSQEMDRSGVTGQTASLPIQITDKATDSLPYGKTIKRTSAEYID